VRDIARSEILSQRDRMAADFFSREVAVALTCAMFAFILPWQVVAAVWAVCILTEVGDVLCYRAIERHPTRVWHAALLANSAVAFSAFSLLGALAWDAGDPMLRFIALLTLVGALVNVSAARSIHLPLGLTCGLPPAVALGWIATGGFRSGQDLTSTALASVATAILLGYFVSALIQNHRTQSALAAETHRARQASAAKSRFISEMSHEMRTPLNVIGGLAALLREASDPASRRTAGRIEAAARDLSGLVDEVFDLSAAAEGALRARPLAVDVRREARSLATLLTADADGRPAPVAVSVAPDVPDALTFDPVMVQKLLRLLAAEAARRFGPALVAERLSLCQPANGGDLQIAIWFQRGVEGAGTPPRTDSGQSLGSELLTVLRTLVGARVDWGAGTAQSAEVTLTLPVGPADPLPGTAPSGPAAAFADLRALVVDDIATNRFILVQMLRKMQIAATEADSGTAALSALGAGHFDVVLLDMNMPGMDGVETFRGIRSGTGQASADAVGVPVIALTAAGAGNRDRLLGLGLDGYVAKPVEDHRLREEIASVLASRGPVGATRTATRPAGPVSSEYPSARPDAPAP
jgi:CheY-like chemotaxis protein/signal transduction histidine kinase